MKPRHEEINGAHYVFFNGTMTRMEKFTERDEPVQEEIKFFTLQGLVDYIEHDVDGIFNDADNQHIVRVTNERIVEIMSKPVGHYKKRTHIARVDAPVPAIKFGQFLETEDFQTMLQTCFEESENRNLVLELAGSVCKEQSINKSDDGMKQTVTIKDGITTLKNVTFKNPVKLTPLRTFYEVQQPTSPFVLRFDENGKAAIFDGDGGAWKLEAVKRIKEWLETQLYGYNVKVIG